VRPSGHLPSVGTAATCISVSRCLAGQRWRKRILYINRINESMQHRRMRISLIHCFLPCDSEILRGRCLRFFHSLQEISPSCADETDQTAYAAAMFVISTKRFWELLFKLKVVSQRPCDPHIYVSVSLHSS